VRYGDLHLFLLEHGRHRVWTLRQSGLSWDEIAAQLGISSDRTRSWYLKWSPQLEDRYQQRWHRRTVRVSIGADDLRVLSSDADSDEALLVPPTASEPGVLP
jgi:hypothetical protein